MAKKAIGFAATLLAAVGCYSGATVKEEGRDVYQIMGTKGVHTEQKAQVNADGSEGYSSRTLGVGLDGNFKDVDQALYADRKQAGKLQTSIDGAAKEKVYQIKKNLIEQRYKSQISSLNKELEAAKKDGAEAAKVVQAKLNEAEQKYQGALKALDELQKFQEELQKPEEKKQ